MKTSNLFSYLAFLNLNHKPTATTSNSNSNTSNTQHYFPAILRRADQQ